MSRRFYNRRFYHNLLFWMGYDAKYLSTDEAHDIQVLPATIETAIGEHKVGPETWMKVGVAWEPTSSCASWPPALSRPTS